MFPVNTYTVQENDNHSGGSSGGSGNNNPNNRLSISLQSALSVADRISELEKQQKYSYLDPDKKHKIPDPTLKAIQKKALLSFYERHHNNHPPASKSAWRSEPQLAHSPQQLSAVPPPPPKVKAQMPSRRASSASDYASGNTSKRSSLASSMESKTTDSLGKTTPRHQHSNSCGSLAADMVVGPVIVGPSISVDDWVPERPPARPPKNPHLRTAFPDLFQDQRVPSPDLPPPSPPTVVEDEVFNTDEPLPPPPPECETEWQEFNDRFKEGTSGHQMPAPQVQKATLKKEVKVIQQTVGIPERNLRYSSVRSSIKTKPGEQIFHQVSSKPYVAVVQAEKSSKPDQILGFPNQRGYQERSSTRYPSTQKLVLNGNVAVSQKVNGVSDQYKPEPLRPPVRDEIKKQPASLPPDTHRAQRASIAESPVKEAPPPLQPRQMRVNQSMRVRMPHDHRSGAMSRSSPMKEGLREHRSASL
ncbi:hypothetical protein NQ318_009206 [Aromia moschata]|uniref:Uncharacterized protein n=1 Tax=Aromia moschata TaxID=1265417 RepID=A0AAV8XVB9_9CUCU|nr:hypothetical protein NQ318_009206 [Aromia moschata]